MPTLDFSLTQMGVTSLVISYLVIAATCIGGALAHTENYKKNGQVNPYDLLFTIVASLLWLPTLIFLAIRKTFKRG